MPVSGPGERPIVGIPVTPAAEPAVAKTGTPPATTTAEAPATPGWSAGNQSQRPVDLTVPPPAVSVADMQASMPNPFKQAMQNNVDSFTRRIEVALNQDAMSIARGKTPVREGDELTAAQQDELLKASGDFVKDIPLGAMSPELATQIEAKLRERGLEPKDMQNTRLGDLGKVGGEIARDMARDLVGDLKKNSPTAFYSLAATLAAGIGYAAWSQGSAKLSRLGIKPEVKTSFLHDHLELKVGADWQPHFKDAGATATVTARTDVGQFGKLSASVTANTRTGFDNARVDATYNDGSVLAANAYVTANRNGLQDAGGAVVYKPQPNLTLSGTVNHNFQTNRTTATGEVAYQVRPNVDLALSASHDSSGDSRIGVGVRIGF